jgi:ABC-2 type transport system permease protein
MAWLVGQDLLLAARALLRARAGLAALVLLATLFIALHGAYAYLLHAASGEGAMLGSAMRAATRALGNWTSLALVAALTAWTALWASVTGLFGARDLDLWLAAPVPAGRVFVVRGLGLAAQLLLPLIFLLGPLAHVGLFTGHPLWLAIYPVLIGFALLSVAAGMAVAMMLLARLGLTRTRQGLHALLVLATLASYAFLIRREPGGLVGAPLSLSAMSPALLLAAALALPLVGAAALLAAARLATHRVVQNVREGTLDRSRSRSPLQASSILRFPSGLVMAVLLKEWRLLRRGPGALGRLWPLLFCGALGYPALRGAVPAHVLPLLFGVLAVYVATALAGGWASRVFMGEAAPALLACAPVQRSHLLASKLLAALLPAWLLSLPVALFVLHLQPSAAVWLLPCWLGGPLAAGGIGLCTAPSAGERTDGDRDRAGLGQRALATLFHNAFSLAWVALTFWLANAAR